MSSRKWSVLFGTVFGGAVLMAAAPAGNSPVVDSAMSCFWCTVDETGGIHRTDVQHGVAVQGGAAGHGWQGGSCGSDGHSNCNQSMLPIESLNRLQAVAAEGDITEVRDLVDADPEHRLLLVEDEGRVDVIGCGGRVVAVVWLRASAAPSNAAGAR